jgi:hypothetical protein
VTAQGIRATWDACFDALQSLYSSRPPETVVVAGPPGNYQPDLVVAMMGIRMPIERPTMSTNRSRDIHMQLDITFSAYVAGGEEAQPLANDMAFDAFAAFEVWVRTGANAKFGGACYESFLISGDVTPAVAWERVDDLPDPVPAGRTADIDAVLESWIRLSL